MDQGGKILGREQKDGNNEDESTNSTITTEASRETPQRMVVFKPGGNSELEKIRDDIMELINRDKEERQELREMMRNMMAGQIGGNCK